LTQELLDQHLPQILDHFQKQKKNLEWAILNQSIQVHERGIVLEITGHMQEEIAEKMKPELIGVIRQVAGVGHFRVSLEHKEEITDQKNKLYTSSDKFNYLLEKHPALKEFTKKFNLETDF
jgi:DNA polymerase-3 subunit gamma/tau